MYIYFFNLSFQDIYSVDLRKSDSGFGFSLTVSTYERVMFVKYFYLEHIDSRNAFYDVLSCNYVSIIIKTTCALSISCTGKVVFVF